MYTSELNMRTKIINDEVISTSRTRTRVPPDRESNVTWHHVIVHGCKGQKYLRSQAQAGPHVEGLSTDGVVTTCTGVT